MLPYRDSFLTRAALAIFFIAVIGYAYYEARGILYGPRITVATDVQEVSDPYIVISGKADRIAALSMNGQPIAVTEDGVFEEPYLLAPGLNSIILDAEDRYGRKRQEVIRVVYRAPEGAAPAENTATSTATSTEGSASSTEGMAP